jgi:hypothetical protein
LLLQDTPAVERLTAELKEIRLIAIEAKETSDAKLKELRLTVIEAKATAAKVTKSFEYMRNAKVIGATTEADLTKQLVKDNKLIRDYGELKGFLEASKEESWFRRNHMQDNFPEVGAREKSECQPFVTAMLEQINAGTVYKRERRKKAIEYATKTSKMELTHHPNDCHANASFSFRKPDIVCYPPSCGGACYITMMGDVKGCGNRFSDFPDDEVGHILDMTMQLMRQHQRHRVWSICFLTDGYRFQYFKVTRQGVEFLIQRTGIFSAVSGWQVCLHMWMICWLSLFCFGKHQVFIVY